MKLGPEQNVQMPMKTVISLIVMVSLGTFGYFQIQEKLNQHDTLLQMHTKDLDQNSEFRIKYPRGELGQSSGESELFMLVEHMAGQITKMEDRMENMMSNSVNILRLQQDMEKVLNDIEKLKDKQRSFANGYAMIETVTALLLFLNGSMIEHVYKPNLSACLKSKRIASRELNPERVIFSCKILKAKIEKEPDSNYGFRIVKVLDD